MAAFEYEGRSCAVRVLKVVLDTGETETLITNLNRRLLPWGQAKNLYFERGNFRLNPRKFMRENRNEVR
jgi:hypothetical protein